MTRPDFNADTERVLIHAPFGRDGGMIREVLRKADIDGIVCSEIEDLVSEISEGAGAVIIGDEALNPETVAKLSAILSREPQWSDLPFVVMTSGGDPDQGSRARLALVKPLGNYTLLERPLRSATLVSAVESALRARRRQYEICGFLRERDTLLAQARESERIYRGIGESIDFGVWICTPDGRCNYVSDSFAKLVGMSQEDCMGFGWGQVLHPDERDQTLEAWKQCAAAGAFWDRVHRFRTQDGGWRHVLARGVPIRGERGEVLCWAGINLDIQREKEVESALQQSNQALRRSNTDLEQFAYAASHDLQEPLRNIAIFSQLLNDRFAGMVDSEGEEFVSLIVSSAKRMQLLIKDLLAYTRATSRDEEEEVHEAIDAQAVLDTLLFDLRHLIRDHSALVSCDPLPAVRVHQVHLQQLFQNLLSNAIKYRSSEPPVIHIGAHPCGKEWLFSIQDNGIGIDPKYAEQIFGIFKRLHNSDEYPGTGIGLAICQKIVERYGGRIWVESELGKGSVFKCTLPG
jgi:PAS domain S-box-containing protein